MLYSVFIVILFFYFIWNDCFILGYQNMKKKKKWKQHLKWFLSSNLAKKKESQYWEIRKLKLKIQQLHRWENSAYFRGILEVIVVADYQRYFDCTTSHQSHYSILDYLFLSLYCISHPIVKLHFTPSHTTITLY